ncbi:MAG: HAMP domain-containing methyl-accepting chemotaxis protein [Nitrospirae bacterium]|nr:HAMP domain-containing methyl-accepting chemotaxis protein [Nitrospirota bacterium]
MIGKIRIKNTLVTNFMVMILLILMIGQGTLYTWLMFYQKSYLKQRLRDEVAATAEHIRDAAVTMGYDSKQLDIFLETIVMSGNIVSVKMIDVKGNILASKAVQYKETDSGINPFFMFYVPESNIVNVPVKTNGKDAGSIEVVYSGQSVNEVMKRFLVIPPVMQVITFLIIIYAIVKFFQRKVGRPVKRINEALARATAGDLTVELSEFRDDEFGSIANGYRFLIDRLASTLNKLRSMSEDVSMAINQLTLTFTNVNQGTQKQTESINKVTASIKHANESHKQITEDVGKLIDFSNENVTSLLEMKATADEIAFSTGRLFKATEDAYSVVAEMSQTAKVIAENAEEASFAVEDTSASVEEINASVKEVEVNAKESARLAADTRAILGGQCIDAVSDAINSMDTLISEVKQSSDTLSQLSGRSADIEKILKVIKDVTEQTNLLSLNAAILAAQAGEYGKSFSVVADEMRGLSDRTAASTKEISKITKTIQSEIADAVKAIDSSMKKADESNALVFKSGEDMAKALETAQKSATMAEAIERATEEQAKGLKQIAVAVENIRKMMEHTAKATHEQQAGTAHLLESVSDVKDAANIVKRGAEEEAAGIKAVSTNLELADERIKQIGEATSGYQKVNENTAAAMEHMRAIGMTTVKDVEEVSISLTTLFNEIELLKKEMSAFKVKNAK